MIRVGDVIDFMFPMKVIRISESCVVTEGVINGNKYRLPKSWFLKDVRILKRGEMENV